MKIKLINILKIFTNTFIPYDLGVIKAYLKNKKINAEICDLDILIKRNNSKNHISNKIDVDYIRQNISKLNNLLKETKKDNYIDEEFEKIISFLNIKSNEVLFLQCYEAEKEIMFYLAKKIKEKKSNKIIIDAREIKKRSNDYFNILIKELRIDYINYFILLDPFSFFDKLINNEIKIEDKKSKIYKNNTIDPTSRWILPEFNLKHLNYYKINPNKIEFFYYELNSEIIKKISELNKNIRPLNLPYMFQVGCNHKCAYCGYRKGIKFKTSTKINKEIDFLKKKYKTTNFDFFNTSMPFDQKEDNEIIKKIKNNNIKWTDYSNISMLNKKNISDFKDAGCIGLATSLTTASTKLTKYINRLPKTKPINHYLSCFKIMDENNLWNITTLIPGLPFEKKEDIIKTKIFLLKYKKYINGIKIGGGFKLMNDSPFAKKPLKYQLEILNKKNTSNEAGYNFNEINGLNWNQKIKQINISKVYFKNLINNNFSKEINSTYLIHLLYENFNSKKEINKFLFS